MSDLTEFLLARIAEDEALLPCANCGRPVEPDPPDFGHVAAALPESDPRAAEFWANTCPAPEPDLRALAEVKAKWRIVERCAPLADMQVRRQTRSLALDTLLAIAQPYAGHPSYREEWKP